MADDLAVMHAIRPGDFIRASGHRGGGLMRVIDRDLGGRIVAVGSREKGGMNSFGYHIKPDEVTEWRRGRG